MKRSLLFVLIGLLAVSLVLTSCFQKANKVLVATDATYPPFEYVDEKTREIIGFDIDLMKAIAQKENLEIEFIDVRFEPLLEGMAQGKYDAAIAAISITEERKKDMLFSDPYFVAGHVITVSKDNTTITGKDSLKGKTVGVKTGTTSAIEVSEMHDVTIKMYADDEESFQALMNGEIDAVVSDNIFALSLVNKNPTKIKLAGEPFTQEYYGIAVAKNKAELLAKINASLKAVESEGSIEELSKKWLLPSSELNDTVITLERTACHGKCPVYELTIYGSGAVIYEGKDFVRITGKAEGTISQEQIKQLVSEFEKANYYSLNDSYIEVTITDFPYVTTSITIDGKTKAIKHYHGDLTTPKQLTELEDKIDEIVNSDQWVK